MHKKESFDEILSFLTTEPLSKRFQSPFELVNYAIQLAKQALNTKRPSMLHQSVPNLSQQLLLEIVNNQDLLIEAALQKAKEQQIEREQAALQAEQEAEQLAAQNEKAQAAKQRAEKRQQARAARAPSMADV